VDLKDIITELNERKQRVTYGALAGVLGVVPRAVMAGRQRNHGYSWVVTATGPRRGQPTGYTYATQLLATSQQMCYALA